MIRCFDTAQHLFFRKVTSHTFESDALVQPCQSVLEVCRSARVYWARSAHWRVFSVMLLLGALPKLLLRNLIATVRSFYNRVLSTSSATVFSVAVSILCSRLVLLSLYCGIVPQHWRYTEVVYTVVRLRHCLLCLVSRVSSVSWGLRRTTV